MSILLLLLGLCVLAQVTRSGYISTIVGTGARGYSGSDVPAQANLNASLDICCDGIIGTFGSSFYIADTGNHIIRYYNGDNGRLFTRAGRAQIAGKKDAIGTSAEFNMPSALCYYKDKTTSSPYLYVADTSNHIIRQMLLTTGDSKFSVSTIAGSGVESTSNPTMNFLYDATIRPTDVNLKNPRGLSVSPSGGIFISDDSSFIYRMSRNGDQGCNSTEEFCIAKIIGIDDAAQDSVVNNPKTYVLNRPRGIYAYSGGAYIVDMGGNNVLEYVSSNPTFGVTAAAFRVAGSEKSSAGFSGDGFSATLAELNAPTSVVVLNSTTFLSFYISDTANHRIRKVSGGIISSIIGSYCATTGGSFSGDGGDASSACLHSPAGIEIDSEDNLIIADAGNNVIRIIYPRQPTGQPSSQPSQQPSRRPSSQPSRQPSRRPTLQPLSFPTSQPSSQPSRGPSGQPSLVPTLHPSSQPTSEPSFDAAPMAEPSGEPSSSPTSKPTVSCKTCEILKSNFFDSQIDREYVAVKVDFFLATYVVFFAILFVVLFILDKSKVGSEIANKLLNSACTQDRYATFLDESESNTGCDELSIVKKYRAFQVELLNAHANFLVREKSCDKLHDSKQPASYPDDYQLYILNRRCYFGCEAIVSPKGLKFPCFRERLPKGRLEDYLIYIANNHSVISCIFTIKGSKYSRTSRRVVFTMQHMCTFTLVAFTESIILLVNASPSVQPLFNSMVIAPLSIGLNVAFRRLFTLPFFKKTTFNFLLLSMCSFILGFSLLLLAALFSLGNRYTLITTYALEVFVLSSFQEFVLSALLYHRKFYFSVVMRSGDDTRPLFTVGACFIEEYLRVQLPAGLVYRTGHKKILQVFLVEWAYLASPTGISQRTPHCSDERGGVYDAEMSFGYRDSYNEDAGDGVVEMVENPLLVLKREKELSMSRGNSLSLQHATDRDNSVSGQFASIRSFGNSMGKLDGSSEEQSTVDAPVETFFGMISQMGTKMGIKNMKKTSLRRDSTTARDIDSDVLRKFKGRRGSYFEKVVLFETNAIKQRGKEKQLSLENTMYLAKSASFGKNALISTSGKQGGSSKLRINGSASSEMDLERVSLQQKSGRRTSVFEMIASAITGNAASGEASLSTNKTNRKASIIQMINDAMPASGRSDDNINILKNNDEDEDVVL